MLTRTHPSFWSLETCPPLSSCGPLSDCQSEWCQRCTDQRRHWFAEFIQAVGVDHPAAWAAVSGLPQTLPPLHPCPAQTGNRLSLVHLTTFNNCLSYTLLSLYFPVLVFAEVLQDRHQHQAGWPGVRHVSAEVPAAGLCHADDPPCALPCRRPQRWGQRGGRVSSQLVEGFSPDIVSLTFKMSEESSWFFFFFLLILRELWTLTSGPSLSPDCCSCLWRSSAGKELFSWTLGWYDTFSTHTFSIHTETKKNVYFILVSTPRLSFSLLLLTVVSD